MNGVVIAGVASTRFGRFEAGYQVLGAHAASAGLAGVGIAFADIALALVACRGTSVVRRPVGTPAMRSQSDPLAVHAVWHEASS